MARLVLVTMILGAVCVAAFGAAVALRGARGATTGAAADATLPATVRTISYAVLLVLTIGASLGWLGAS
ncbi:hypothetical protein SAMN04488003_103104 [Loktanella fryxellensis]|uniref:Uncharacterized protein n=1 Tax=Loktanella fryxellensis TaxID=245187 RepID=A0A1H8AC54_9RHOB|nr:hypothetical protein [Loktanella fryxellensis]SEM68133.1 hypothetical protein SAMN04488003_103104 [Loktanella fryxellensis]